jgi:endogenous inhibitor of DNA gyrase (YacG/DUF329 family)
MKKLRKASCPYCGRKVGIFRSFLLKTQGEYHCPKCGAYSNIRLDSAIYLFAALAALLSVIFFGVHLLLIRNFSWLSLFLVSFPFLLFYIFSPFLVRLQKPVPKHPAAGRNNIREAAPKRENDSDRKNGENMERTIVMDGIKNR